MKPLSHKLTELRIKPTKHSLLVSIPEQTLQLIREGEAVRDFVVSTGRKPPSCVENSFGTPTGLHRIAKKIGTGAPEGEVFKGRVSVGKRYWELGADEQERNLVTTRILWLEGLESGINSGPGIDTFDRYVYIHGTNHEEKLGQPASAGCVVLSNAEVIELYDLVEEGDLVFIQA